MARSRNIKPGFFANEELADLPFEARLLFIGLWTLADREGRLEDRPKRIRAQVFPYDSIDAEPLMAMLATAGFIVRYEAGGERFAQILNFSKHQMPHHKEVASEIPAPEGHKQITRHAYDVPSKVREEVFARDGGACLKCGSAEDLSLDHIQALGSGGDNSINNLQTLCTSCNSSKGNSTKDYRKVNVDATLNQRQTNHGASCPSDSGFLTTDSQPLIPSSVPTGTGGKPPLTPDEIIFGYGVPLLTSAGSTDKAARSFLGGLRKAHGDESVVNTLRDCIRAKPLQPLEWLAAALPPGGIRGKPNAQEALEASNRAVVDRLLAKEKSHAI